MYPQSGEQGGAGGDLRYRRLETRRKWPYVLFAIIVLFVGALGAVTLLGRSASTKFSSVAFAVADPTSSTSSAGYTSLTYQTSPSVYSTYTTSTTSSTSTTTTRASTHTAVVVSKGCSSTCRVYRRKSPNDDLSQKGSSYQIDGDVVTVACSQHGELVHDTDSAISDDLWYRLDSGYWLSAIYLNVSDPSTVPTCS